MYAWLLDRDHPLARSPFVCVATRYFTDRYTAGPDLYPFSVAVTAHAATVVATAAALDITRPDMLRTRQYAATVAVTAATVAVTPAGLVLLLLL